MPQIQSISMSISKLSGEGAVEEETDDFLILRFSWICGEVMQDFIHKLLESNVSLAVTS